MVDSSMVNKMFSIRRIRKSDVASLGKMINALNHFHAVPERVLLDFLDQGLFASKISIGYILVKSKRAIGFSVGYDFMNYVHNKKHHQIDLFFVTEPYRGKGLGRLLLDTVVQKSKVRGCHVVDVSASPYNKEAQKFYKACGFFLRDKPSKRFRLIIE